MFLNFKLSKTIVVLLAFCLFTLSRCKMPDDPVLPNDGAVFYLTGTVNGAPFTIEAGQNGYYMYTDYSYNTTDSLYRFEGNLKKSGCTNCGKGIEILIADAQTTTGTGSANIALALQQSSYSYAGKFNYLSKEYVLSFAAEGDNYVNPSYAWDFGGGLSADTTSATPTVIFPDSSTRTVCLTITDKTTLCSKTICNRVKPFDVDLGDSLVPNFYYTVGKTIIFNNKSTANSFLWEFGDTRTSVAYTPEYLYDKPGTYTVCLTTVANGIARRLCKNVIFKDPITTCQTSFSYHSPKVNTTPAKQNSQVIIRYTDDNGEVYESDARAQTGSSAFNLLSHTGYDANEQGQKTQRLGITFSCRVYSKTNASFKDIVVTGGYMGVAYP